MAPRQMRGAGSETAYRESYLVARALTPNYDPETGECTDWTCVNEFCRFYRQLVPVDHLHEPREED